MGLVEVVTTLKDIILGIVFRRGVLAEVWIEVVASAVSAGLPSIGVLLLTIKSSK